MAWAGLPRCTPAPWPAVLPHWLPRQLLFLLARHPSLAWGHTCVFSGGRSAEEDCLPWGRVHGNADWGSAGWEQRLRVPAAQPQPCGGRRGVLLLGRGRNCRNGTCRQVSRGLPVEGFCSQCSPRGGKYCGRGWGTVVGQRSDHGGFQRPWSPSIIINDCNDHCGNFLRAHRSRMLTCFPPLVEH